MSENKFFSPAELAEALGVSVETIYQWTSQKKIPHLKVGRLVKFSRTETNKWLNDKKVSTYENRDSNDKTDTTFLRMGLSAYN